MNKDDQELFGIVNSSGVIPKKDFILMLMDNTDFTRDRLISRVKNFISGPLTYYGFFQVNQISKYYLIWGAAEGAISPDLDSSVIRNRTSKELDQLLKVALDHENEENFEDYNETVFKGDYFLYCPTIKDSILLSIFNRDVERNIAKRYSKIQTAAEFFSILEKTVIASSPNKWTEGMLFRDQFKFLKKQIKSKNGTLLHKFRNT